MGWLSWAALPVATAVQLPPDPAKSTALRKIS